MFCRPLQVGVREGSRPGLGGRGLAGGEGLHAGGVQRLLRLQVQWQLHVTGSIKTAVSVAIKGLRVLFENRPALYFCNYKENKRNNTRILDTLLTEDFIDSVEECFHF